MRKIITVMLTVVMLLMVCLCIAGCNDPSRSEDYIANSDRLVEVESSPTYSIYYDRETKVMYLFMSHGYSGGITVMLDENGEPLLYQGDENEVAA